MEEGFQENMEVANECELPFSTPVLRETLSHELVFLFAIQSSRSADVFPPTELLTNSFSRGLRERGFP